MALSLRRVRDGTVVWYRRSKLSRLTSSARTRWNRSLQLRVIVTTMVLSGLVTGLLGWTVYSQVRHQLLTSQRNSALAEADAGYRIAAPQLAAPTLPTQDTTTGENPTRSQPEAGPPQQSDSISPDDFARQRSAMVKVLQQLAQGSSVTNLYDVIILPVRSELEPVYTSGANDTSIPRDLSDSVANSDSRDVKEFWAYTELRRRTGNDVQNLGPGVVVGMKLGEQFQLYYLFPLQTEQQTLTFVQRLLLVTGLVVVLLLAGLAWLVTRQVVKPVQAAARTAERLAAGLLEERMTVRGEDELALLAQSFNGMAASLQRQIAQLEELSRLQRRFTSDVSHELRTPLTTVRMAADVLYASRAHFPPETTRAAELLQQQLDRFEDLLEELLEISRHDAGAAVLDTEVTDLRAVVEAVADEMGALAPRQGCALELDLPDAPTLVEVDPRRVRRILRNLVGNALDYGAGGPVRIRMAGDTAAVAITVRDFGVGLRPGETAAVFQRFWRADQSRARTTGGTGLGLSISLEDARLHGGWLQAWGEPDGGAQFRLTLPRRVGGPLIRSPLPLEPDRSDPPAAVTAEPPSKDPRKDEAHA
jgi:two-component system sensor histidine kinase MtrB